MEPKVGLCLTLVLVGMFGFFLPVSAQYHNGPWLMEPYYLNSFYGPPQVPSIGTSPVLVVFSTGPSASTRRLPEWGRMPWATPPNAKSIWDTITTDTISREGNLRFRKYWLDVSFGKHNVLIDTVIAIDDTLALSIGWDNQGLQDPTFDTLTFWKMDSLVDLRRFDSNHDDTLDYLIICIVGYGPDAFGNAGINYGLPWESKVHPGFWIKAGHRQYIPPGYPQWAGLFLTCHEYGHGLGVWYDLYGSQSCHTYPYDLGIGGFCLMGHGYCASKGNPIRPVPPNPLYRCKVGWSNLIEVTEPLYRTHLSDFNTGGSVYKLPIATQINPYHYWMIANYDKAKYWARSLPGRGLLAFDITCGNYPWETSPHVKAAHGMYDWNRTDPCQPINLLTQNDSTGLDSIDVAAQQYPGMYQDTLEASASCFFNPATKTIFDGLSNPSTRILKFGGNGEYEQTHCAVYNIARDPADSTVIVADLLVNNWYGNITQNTTWGPGHYVVTGDVTVNSGVTLTILQGTTVDFYQGDNQSGGIANKKSELIVLGKLKAKGTRAQPIKFRSNLYETQGGTPTNTDWWGIRLRPGSTDTLIHCQVSDCYAGIHADSVAQAMIDTCTVTNTLTYGIRLTNVRTQTGGMKVRGNRILQPSPTYGFYVERSNNTAPTTAWKIEGNYIETYNYGIYVNADSMGTDRLSIYRDSVVTPFWSGGMLAGVHLEGTKGAVRVQRCRLIPGATGTAAVEVMNRVWPKIDSCKLYSPPDMYNNHAAYGIYIENQQAPSATSVTNVRRDSIANFANGVYVANCSVNPPRLGIRNDPTFPGQNNIIGYRSEFGNSWLVYYWGLPPQTTLRAEDNWWGSNPPYADQFFGPVDYNPYRTTPATQSWVCSEPGGGSATQSGELVDALLPTHFDLGQSYPNPANGELTIRYALPQGARVSMKVYNVAGQLVKSLVTGPMKAGYHSVRWDGKTEGGHSAGPGVYFYRMDAGTFTSTKKLILAR